jgi:hypothetical protein
MSGTQDSKFLKLKCEDKSLKVVRRVREIIANTAGKLPSLWVEGCIREQYSLL